MWRFKLPRKYSELSTDYGQGYWLLISSHSFSFLSFSIISLWSIKYEAWNVCKRFLRSILLNKNFILKKYLYLYLISARSSQRIVNKYKIANAAWNYKQQFRLSISFSILSEFQEISSVQNLLQVFKLLILPNLLDLLDVMRFKKNRERFCGILLQWKKCFPRTTNRWHHVVICTI